MTKRGSKKPHRRLKGKGRSQIIHLGRRLGERFDIHLTQSNLESIVEIIRNNKSISVKRQSNNRSIHLVRFQERHFRVVYDKKRGLPITVLFTTNREEFNCYGPKS